MYLVNEKLQRVNIYGDELSRYKFWSYKDLDGYHFVVKDCEHQIIPDECVDVCFKDYDNFAIKKSYYKDERYYYADDCDGALYDVYHVADYVYSAPIDFIREILNDTGTKDEYQLRIKYYNYMNNEGKVIDYPFLLKLCVYVSANKLV